MQRKLRNNLFFFILVFFATTFFMPTGSMAANKLLILYGNDVRGELEACG